MISGIFSAIQLLLKLIGLWEQFQSWSDAKRAAEAEEKRQKREEALNKLEHAEGDDAIFDAQQDVIDNKP